jgi:phosphopentomutase
VEDNDEGISRTIELTKHSKGGIILANLGDFDTLYGHRNNPQGFADALQAFDHRLPEIQAVMRPGDVAFITADHGCDPTTASTDHSREHVPLLVWGAAVKHSVNLGTRSTFADLGATVASLLGLAPPQVGESFAQVILYSYLTKLFLMSEPSCAKLMLTGTGGYEWPRSIMSI